MSPELHALALALTIVAVALMAVRPLPSRGPLAVRLGMPFVLLAVAAGAGVLALWLSQQGAPSTAAGWLPAVFISASTAAVALAPWHPLPGPLAYFVVSYLFARNDVLTTSLMDAGLPSMIAGFSFLGTLLQRLRRRDGHADAPGAVPIALAIFGCWVAMAVVAAVLGGRPLAPDLLSRVTRYAQAFTVAFALAGAPLDTREARPVALAMATLLIVRQLAFTESVLYDQNLAMLIAVALPFVAGVAVSRPLGPVNIALAAAAVYLAVLLVAIQNRGGVLGLAAAVVAMWLFARHRWRWAIAAAAAVLPAALWAASHGYFRRFGEIYVNGRFAGSAGERLDIWSGGVRMALDHWLVGVGPGNFAEYLSAYSPERSIPAHSAPMEILAEMGVVGAAAYLALFVVTLHRLIRFALRASDESRRAVAVALIGALVAHLVAGSFLSNANLVWTYALLGIAAALTRSMNGASPPSSPD